MTEPRPLDVLRWHGQLAAPRPGDVMVTAGVGPGGSAVALWAAPRDAAALRGRTLNTPATSSRRLGFTVTSRSMPKVAAALVGGHEGGASFADVALREPVAARVTIHEPSQATRVVSIRELRLAQPMVQPMPDGAVLVVGTRCAWTPDGVVPNAALYGADGSLRRTAVVGDGVQHLRSTPAGEVWIGYSDQGIYGSLGWGRPGPAPLGHSGLVRFGTDLTLAWEFPRGDAPPRISDCDALNVDGGVWTCYYTDFPVARIDHDLVTTWPTGLVAVSALLVDQDRIASVGAQVTFAHIEGDDLRVTSTRPLILPPEAETPGTHLIGQGPSLHALTPSGDWYLADLDTLTTQSR